jgi:hypothetical protein
MSIKYSSAYVAQPGDTVKRIAHAFRLSSSRAILEVPSNTHLTKWSSDAVLEAGTKVSIPPNAGELLKERLYALHAVRPMLFAHFDKQRSRAEEDLRDVALSQGVPVTPGEISHALAGMQALVVAGMEDIAQASVVFAEIGRGIAETHVANANDRAIAGSTVGALTGLYWLISAQYVNAWSGMWGVEVWTNKWAGKDGANAWQAADQYLNTIRSIVVQQVDTRIRETLALENALLSEG